ncbi:MAG: protein kinase [Deltaproteobacteria bacterium]|nr:protein kinase [Deltaproteobacteria bacterium]
MLRREPTLTVEEAPSNVFLTREGGVKLLDFGIAKSPDVEGLTGTGQTIGTPGYMSPEQAAGDAIDARSDLFSLGCVIFRMLGGKQPFRGSDLMVFATQLALEEAPPLESVCPEAPPALSRLVASLLQKKAADRPETAKSVRDALDRIASGAAVSAPPSERGVEVPEAPIPSSSPASSPPSAPSTPSPPPRSITSVVLAIAAVAALAGGLVALQRTREAAPAPPAATSASTSASTRTAMSASASTSASASAASREDTRSALRTACREWATAITRNQSTSGGFAGNEHADPTGWDTAQQTFALTEAHRACAGVGPAPILAGVKALEPLRAQEGWIGMRRASAPNARDRRAETPANAWALMAISGAERVTGEASLATAKAKARANLDRGRLADGGYRYVPAKTNGATLHATLLAAWAHLETDDAKAPLSAEGKGALAWLRREIASGSEAARVLGITEQVAWVLARAERREPDPANAEPLRILAIELIAHCELHDGACARPIADTGHIPFDDGDAKLVALWHPWLVGASFELARESALPLDTDVRAKLATISGWANARLASATPTVAMAPEYKIGEYLVAVSRTLDP